MKYLVVEEGWEYNDEYYYQGEDAGYNIISSLYDTKEAAQAVVKEKNDKLKKDNEWFVDSENQPIRPFKVVAVKEQEVDSGSDDVLKDAESLIASYIKQKEELVKRIKKALPIMLKPIFQKYPVIKSIGWSQYTPYFNDGDTCIFGVNTYELYVNGEYQDSLWMGAEYLRIGKYKKEIESGDIDLEMVKGVEEFRKILESIPNEFYLDMFGDHVIVTIDKDGKVTTKEYDHE